MESSEWFDTVVGGVEALMATDEFDKKQQACYTEFHLQRESADVLQKQYLTAFHDAIAAHMRETVVEYDKDTFFTALGERTAAGTFGDKRRVFEFLESMNPERGPGSGYMIWNRRLIDEAYPGVPDLHRLKPGDHEAHVPDMTHVFGVEELSVEEHEINEAQLKSETEDGEVRYDLNDLLTISKV